jgi:hypothetical protein
MLRVPEEMAGLQGARPIFDEDERRISELPDEAPME